MKLINNMSIKKNFSERLVKSPPRANNYIEDSQEHDCSMKGYTVKRSISQSQVA